MPAQSLPGRRWATVAEVARYTRLSTRTVYQRIADGDWPGYQPQGTRAWLFDLDEVDKLISVLGTESLAAKLNRVLAEETDFSLPDFTDDQIREVARLLPRRQPGQHDAA